MFDRRQQERLREARTISGGIVTEYRGRHNKKLCRPRRVELLPTNGVGSILGFIDKGSKLAPLRGDSRLASWRICETRNDPIPPFLPVATRPDAAPLRIRSRRSASAPAG